MNNCQNISEYGFLIIVKALYRSAMLPTGRNNGNSAGRVIIQFLTSTKSRNHAAASIRFGGNPPLASILSRSLSSV
jgi:hypothetical protein